MAARSPEVDAYVARAPAFARPILARIRSAFHAGCPQLEERIKWGAPSFEYKGLLGGMAAFRAHVGFGFWKARLMQDAQGLFGARPRASAMGVRVSRLADLPARRVLVAYVREAARLNDEGAREPRLTRRRGTLRVSVPADLKAGLAGRAKAKAVFDTLPPSARRDYVEWISAAKRPATRARRLETTLSWLSQGKRRNWKYEARRPPRA